MSGWGRRGSSRAWRELRLLVLRRDKWRCQLLEDDGRPCGRRLWDGHPDPRHRATVEHLDALADGHPLLAPMDRLLAACQTHNGRGGAAMTNRKRETTGTELERGWSW